MILFFTCALAVVCPAIIALLAAGEDAYTLRIANMHSVALAMVFAFAVGGVPYLSGKDGMVAACLVLVPGVLLYALRALGAGDVKLAAMMGLFTGVGGLAEWLLGACLTGGVLALTALVIRRYAPPLLSDETPRHWIDRLRQGSRDIPYGIALAVPFVAVLTQRFVDAYHF